MKKYIVSIFSLLAVLVATIGYTNEIKPEACTVPPGQPQGLTATDGTHGDYVQVSWEQEAGATSYKVYTMDGSFFQETDKLTTWIQHKDAIPGKVYEYTVNAWNDCGWSPYSDVDTGYKACPTSGATVQASDGAYGTGIAIVWDDQPYSIRYDVYRS